MSEVVAYNELRKRSAAKKGVKSLKRAPVGFANLSASLPDVPLPASLNGQVVLAPASSNAVAELADGAATAKKDVDLKDIMNKAAAKAFRGGLAGFAAGAIQVLTFMWMRTTMNYQYRYGGGMMNAIGKLYAEGGVFRFYRGVQYAIIQNPLSRFGDTAANTGVLAILGALTEWPVALQTTWASTAGATFRVLITPVDTLKTTLQVEGPAAMAVLSKKVKDGGIGVLYGGCFANFAANWVGNYPWFATYNYLQANIPKQEGKMKLVRNAVIGVGASAVSDVCSNSLRVIKTVKQTNADASLSYVGVVKEIMSNGGLGALFGRGLQTRLLTNALQSMVFSVAWKAIEEMLSKPKSSAKPTPAVAAISPVAVEAATAAAESKKA